MKDIDGTFIRMAVEVAQRARGNGNHPFGAILVDDAYNVLLTAENTVITKRDCTGHAETNLMREACKRYESEFLARCTLYASTEPCAMCSGAIFWGNVRRVVYGLSAQSLYDMIGMETNEVLRVPCRSIFARGRKDIEVVGPMLEDEARNVHEGFWS